MTTRLTQAIARLLLLPILMIAAAVLVKGYAAVGDGFSAGVIAAVGILLQYVTFGYHEAERLLPTMRLAPGLTFSGLLLALLVAYTPLLWGQPLFSHTPPPGGHVIYLGTLELHSALLFDLGVFLLVFGFAVSMIRLIAQAIDQGDA